MAHVTIAKMSKVKGHQRKKGRSPKRIAEEAYAEHIGIQAGTVLVTELQLCPMQGRQPGSYYNIQKSMKICPAQVEDTMYHSNNSRCRPPTNSVQNDGGSQEPSQSRSTPNSCSSQVFRWPFCATTPGFLVFCGK